MSETSVRWVVFDYGEVISRRTAQLPTLAGLLGTTEEAFAAAYWGERDAYDRGCTDAAYWGVVADRVGAEVSDELVTKLTDTDVKGWLETVPESLALVEELHAAGVGVAVLSNAPVSFRQALERQPWIRRVDHLIVSGDLRCAKPDSAIWAELIDRLQAHPAEMVFFDDKPTNIVGAKEAGLRGLVWQDAATGRASLVGFGLLS